jgi:hypothetical protein
VRLVGLDLAERDLVTDVDLDDVVVRVAGGVLEEVVLDEERAVGGA